MKSTIEFMRAYQAWRRGAGISQPDPKAIGEGLNRIILAAERYEKLRRLNPRKFHELYMRNISEGKPFDELADEL